MPIATFLILIGAALGLLGVTIPFILGVEADPQDLSAREFLWATILAFPLFLSPLASILKLRVVTRNMAAFATVCAGLMLLLLLWIGMAESTSFRVGYLVTFLAAAGMLTGGVMGINNPPDEELR